MDDDANILVTVSDILDNGDYNILTADTGSLALARSRNFNGEIHLLLSDFEMPGMSGVDLATAMTNDRPALKVLLMSGFSGGTLILNEGWHFLDKPFDASELRALVTGLLSPERIQILKVGRQAPNVQFPAPVPACHSTIPSRIVSRSTVFCARERRQWRDASTAEPKRAKTALRSAYSAPTVAMPGRF